jgi:colanic acid/amylovoran biosynthesis glycosyltransferase
VKINLVLNDVPQLSETFLVSWMKLLLERGYSVQAIITGKYFLGRSEKQRFIPGIKYIAKGNFAVFFKGVFFKKGFVSLKSCWKANFISIGDPQLVHFSYSAIGVTYIDEISLLRKKGIKFVVSCRGTSDNIKPYIELGRKGHLEHLFEQIDSVHCVSLEMLNRMVRDFRLKEGKGFVNRPAIDIVKLGFRTAKTPTDKTIVISTGRLEYVKGFVFALLGIQQLVQHGIDVEYRIVGGGKDEEYLRFLIQRLGLENHVYLLGSLSPEKVALELLQADIYLSSSLSEGISNAVLEAMAIGLPVVSTNVGGMPEVIQTEITGLLVEPYEPDQIARAIKRFVEEPDMKNVCIKNSRERIETEYNFERLIQVFDERYESLIS